MSENHPALNIYRIVEGWHPNVWSLADNLQAVLKSGAKLREGCIFSKAEGFALSMRLQGSDASDPPISPYLFGALVSWRPTKGIYRFHPGLYEELINTDLEGNIPSTLLLRMPGHAVYIETPSTEYVSFPFEGFFAYLSRMGKQNELEIVAPMKGSRPSTGEAYNPVSDVISYSLPLRDCSVAELVKTHFASGNDSSEVPPQFQDSTSIANVELVVSSMLSLLLYLCSEKPEIKDWTPPQPKSTYLGTKRRMVAAKAIGTWDVGLRIGAALKLHKDNEVREGGGTGSGSPVRPHIRRAHWHSFWKGKKGEQYLSLRWLPPIPVNFDDEQDLPAVIRPVVT